MALGIVNLFQADWTLVSKAIVAFSEVCAQVECAWMVGNNLWTFKCLQSWSFVVQSCYVFLLEPPFLGWTYWYNWYAQNYELRSHRSMLIRSPESEKETISLIDVNLVMFVYRLILHPEHSIQKPFEQKNMFRSSVEGLTWICLPEA